MESLNNALTFIDSHESLLSGIAAILAIFGVLVAGISHLRNRMTRQPQAAAGAPQPIHSSYKLEVHYARNPSGHRIAWASQGNGPPLIRCLGWFTHLELESRYPLAAACMADMADHFRFIRYDARGMGLSARDVTEVSTDTRLEDLETVMDAAGVERAVLLGFSEGGTTAIRYAAKHPDRVSHLILFGSFLRLNFDADTAQQWAALTQLLNQGKIDTVKSREIQEMLFELDSAYQGAATQSEATRQLVGEAGTILTQEIPFGTRDDLTAIPVPASVLLESRKLKWAMRTILIMSRIQLSALKDLQETCIQTRDRLELFLQSKPAWVSY